MDFGGVPENQLPILFGFCVCSPTVWYITIQSLYSVQPLLMVMTDMAYRTYRVREAASGTVRQWLVYCSILIQAELGNYFHTHKMENPYVIVQCFPLGRVKTVIRIWWIFLLTPDRKVRYIFSTYFQPICGYAAQLLCSRWPHTTGNICQVSLKWGGADG